MHGVPWADGVQDRVGVNERRGGADGGGCGLFVDRVGDDGHDAVLAQRAEERAVAGLGGGFLGSFKSQVIDSYANIRVRSIVLPCLPARCGEGKTGPGRMGERRFGCQGTDRGTGSERQPGWPAVGREVASGSIVAQGGKHGSVSG